MKEYQLLFVYILLLSCAANNKLTSANQQDGYTTTASGLQYKILQKGSGEPAKAGQEVLIFETTTYLNGTVLYSNENSTRPVKVLIGGNQATNAVDEGLRRNAGWRNKKFNSTSTFSKKENLSR